MVLNLLSDTVTESWNLFLEVSPFLIIGFFFAGLIHVFIGKETIRRHLGGHGFSQVVKSVLIGIPLPICSCGIIPLAASLRREGASKASVLSFLFATPVTGVDSILATYAFLGILFAVFRPAVALVGGLLIGLVSLCVEKEEPHDHPYIEPEKRNAARRFVDIFSYGFLYLPKELGRWLLAGILLGGVITAVIPEGAGVAYFNNPLFAYPLMLLFSIPIYVCATGSIPIVAALIGKGLLPGAALAFLIAGPATNTVTAAFVYKEIGRKQFAVYLSGIIVVSVGSGLIFDLFWTGAGQDPALLAGGAEHIYGPVKIISALLLLPLFLMAFIPRRHSAGSVDRPSLELVVSGMTCGGCASSVEQVLRRVEGVEGVKVDLEQGRASISGDADADEVLRAVKEAGYGAEPLDAG